LNEEEDRDLGLSNTMIGTQHLTTVPNFLIEKKGKSERNRTEPNEKVSKLLEEEENYASLLLPE
jgi:hypothetical protein